MLWLRKPLGYDPKDFPNYKLYQDQDTGFQRLVRQWPAIFTFIAWSFTFLASILTIINEWFCMIVRDPLHYNKATEWIIKQYQACPTVFQMSYGALITFWFFHVCYRIGLVICDVLVDAYNDPVWAAHQVLATSYYIEHLFFRGGTFITCAIFNFACSFIVLIYNMHPQTFIIGHNPVPKDQQGTLPSIYTSHGIFAPENPIQPTMAKQPRTLLPAPTPSTTSSSSSSSTDLTPCRRRPSPKSNKPPGASYVAVSPKSAEKLRADGVGVPEPTRETKYSFTSPDSNERNAYVRRRMQLRFQPRSPKFKEVEEHKAEADDEAKFIHSIVPTKTQWVYSALDAIERRIANITAEVTELRTQVGSFKEAGIVLPIPEPSDEPSDGPSMSPRTQKRNATLTERDRIKAAMAQYIPAIENAAVAILKQQHGVEELLARIENLINKAAKSGCSISRAMSGEADDYRIKIKNIFGDARQALIKARSIEEVCEDRRVKLAEEAKRLKRLDRAHLLLLKINAKKREIEMNRR
ncbi:hypothetical protein NXS19_008968 [Fusarium pseudograminearum]|nr:hypothetical protein NXS19_008968 [Fusarium pseudograminearum]